MRLGIAAKGYVDVIRATRTLSPHTYRAYEGDLRDLVSFVGRGEKVEAVTRESLRAYATDLLERRKLAPATARRRIVAVRSFFAWLTDENAVSENPFARLRVRITIPQVLPRALSRSELRTLFRVAREEARPVFGGLPGERARRALTTLVALELLFATGIRVGELCGIREDDIDFQTGVLRVRGKGARERRVFLPEGRVRDLIRRYVKRNLRPGSVGGPCLRDEQGRSASPEYVRVLLAELARRAELDRHLTPHMFRHTTATELLNAGVDIRFVQRLLGHASIATTQRYTHVSDQSLQRVVTGAGIHRLLRGRRDSS